jgi:hypothetical protein
MYTILVNLFDENGELYTTFTQKLEDSFNTEDFDNVIDKFNALVEFVQNNYETGERGHEAFELTCYILDEDGEAIY